MRAGVRQLLGLAVAIVSFVMTIITCALPQWKILKLPDSLVLSEGLWKFCVSFRTLHPSSVTVCKTYGSGRLSVTQDLGVSRALVLIAIIVGVIGILLGAAGSKFINFVPDERKKSKMAMASGVVFLIAGFFVLIPVCWITNTINGNFSNDLGSVIHHSPGSLKRELGASIYLGWLTTGLWFLGGGLLCSSFLRRNGTD